MPLRLCTTAGPITAGSFQMSNASFCDARLSIIDTSHASDQPFYSEDKRYLIIYNGEFFNYKEHRDALQKKGVKSYIGVSRYCCNSILHKANLF